MTAVTPERRAKLFDEAITVHRLAGAHWGTDGEAWGVWGVDAQGHVTFVRAT